MSTDSSEPNLSLLDGNSFPGTPAVCIAADASTVLAEETAAVLGGPAGVVPHALSVSRRTSQTGMTPEARRRIGRNLRLLYAEVLQQPLPDRFDALLADLATRSNSRGSS
ncbi:hypothetical protein ASF60_15460 [Methylobacterium sp. Leaf113]|uniref:NepR family anti-sigma factor n=1 Tax=Methylobacterium sp. Leaf113 TaxID=1736259 RepID=UPI0006FCED3E|nr:NepR family anti-sigma factor [Methylobacterium sp. Leaf113]KQP93325.1 hypothetical protein ASF60_15460 [Methylobacterium sp. Leaf113]